MKKIHLLVSSCIVLTGIMLCGLKSIVYAEEIGSNAISSEESQKD